MESLIKYFCRAKALHDQLQEANPAFKEEDLFWQTIQGLPSIYDTIITIIENDPALELTLDCILPKLVPVEQRHRGDRPDRTTEPALMAKPSFPNHRFSSGTQGPPMRRTDGPRPSFPSNDRRPSLPSYNDRCPSFPSSQERRPSLLSSNERRPSFPSTDRRQEEQDRGDGSCLYCHKPGHWASECRKKKQDMEARRNNRGAPTPPRHNQFSAIAFTAAYYPEAGVGLLPPLSSKPYAFSKPAQSAATEPTIGGTMRLVVDTGASRHMTPSKGALTSLRPPPEGLTITFGNGTTATPAAEGDIYMELAPGHLAVITDVLYLPAAAASLLSVSYAAKKGLNFSFDAGKCISKGPPSSPPSPLKTASTTWKALSSPSPPTTPPPTPPKLTRPPTCGTAALGTWALTTWPRWRASSLRDAMEAAFTAEEVASLARRTAQRKAVFGPLAPWLHKQACAQLAPLAAAEFNAWQRIGRLPRGDAHSAIALVAKTSSPTQPSDLRGIAVGALLAKLFAAGLERRVTAHTEAAGLHAEGQFGFRRQRSTEQAALALRTVIECHRQQRQCGGSSTRSEQPQRRHTRRRRQRGGSQLWACFVDFKQAYDRVPRAQLWQRLESMGYGGQWLQAVRALYADVPMSVTAPGLEGRVFSAMQGLKQGCPLSPTLFSLYIADWEERVLSAAAAGMPLALPQLAGQPVPPLMYADDMALLATTANGLQQQLRILEQYCAERGLTVNVVKTKVMLLSGAADEQTAMQRVRRARHTFDGAPVAGVAAFKYLGLVFHCTQPVGEAAAEGRARVARFAAASLRAAAQRWAWRPPASCSPSTDRSDRWSTPPSPMVPQCGPLAWPSRLCGASAPRLEPQAAAAACQRQSSSTTAHCGACSACRSARPEPPCWQRRGSPPLHAHWLARTARFWNSLVAAPEGSLMRQVLDGSLQLAAEHTPSRHRGPHGIAQLPWAAQLQSALAEAGIAADLQQRQPLQPEAVQEAALQHYLQHLQTAVQRRGASRLQHYFDCVRPECLEVAGYGMAPYLVEVRERHRRLGLAELRSGEHWGAEERERLLGPARRPRDHRYCMHCAAAGLGGRAEDADHIVFECALYAHLRPIWFPDIFPAGQPPLPPETGSHVAQPNRLATLLGCEFPREEDSAMAGEAGGAARRRALALAAFTGACRRTGRRAAGLPTTYCTVLHLFVF